MHIRLLPGRDFCMVMEFECLKEPGANNLAEKNVHERLTEVIWNSIFQRQNKMQSISIGDSELAK